METIIKTEDSPPNEELSFPQKIERTDLQPHPMSIGDTEVVLQRHGKYVRDKEDPRRGSLTPEAVAEETEAAKRYFTELFELIPADERSRTDLLVVASDTQYY